MQCLGIRIKKKNTMHLSDLLEDALAVLGPHPHVTGTKLELSDSVGGL